MAKINSLASELLSQIHCLSVENAPPSERQAARHQFILVGRAFFLALANPTEFHVGGAIQACHFWKKLEQEKKWEVLVASNKPKMTRTELKLLRTTRGISDIRRLVLIANDSSFGGLGRVFERILRRATETNLVALNLILVALDPRTRYRSSELTPPLATLAPLSDVFGGLVGLRWLRIASRSMEPEVLLRILIPLHSLEVLDLPMEFTGLGVSESLRKLSFPHLHTLRFSLGYYHEGSRPFGITLLRAAGTKLQVLDLGSTWYDVISAESTIPLLPSVSNIVHLTWNPEPGPLLPEARDGVLILLGSMKNLESVSMTAWIHVPTFLAMVRGAHLERPLDPTLIDTLATLPRLHTVKICMSGGLFEEALLVSFIRTHTPLRSLSLVHELNREEPGWSQEQRDRVQAAAVEAGVVFEYRLTVRKW